jgi:hypothetical protein
MKKRSKRPKGKEDGPRGIFAYHYLDPYTGKVMGSTKAMNFLW